MNRISHPARVVQLRLNSDTRRSKSQDTGIGLGTRLGNVLALFWDGVKFGRSNGAGRVGDRPTSQEDGANVLLAPQAVTAGRMHKIVVAPVPSSNAPRCQRIPDIAAEPLDPQDVLVEWLGATVQAIADMRRVQRAYAPLGDVVAPCRLEVWIDAGGQRGWLLHETVRVGGSL